MVFCKKLANGSKTDDNIIIGSIFINEPYDSKALEKLYPKLKKNFEILLELQKKYGTRKNYKEIKKPIKTGDDYMRFRLRFRSKRRIHT